MSAFLRLLFRNRLAALGAVVLAAILILVLITLVVVTLGPMALLLARDYLRARPTPPA